MMKTKKNIKLGLNPISTVIFFVLIGVSIGFYYVGYINTLFLVFFLIISLFAASSLHIADQWEKAIILRMGKYIGLRGPGIFFIIPIIDKIDNYIDQRVRVTEFKAEQTLTKDTVPVNVDAVVYWTVWDVEKAALDSMNLGAMGGLISLAKINESQQVPPAVQPIESEKTDKPGKIA